jgi:hypothetical protein
MQSRKRNHRPMIPDCRLNCTLQSEVCNPRKFSGTKSGFLDSAELPVNGQFCCARNDKLELIGVSLKCEMVHQMGRDAFSTRAA